jgi:hypothetical protein
MNFTIKPNPYATQKWVLNHWDDCVWKFDENSSKWILQWVNFHGEALSII